ncbi:hypothetical protein BOX15_Mlig022140g2 [Macrostomum lignano]|uniref:Uncharacterized protein n=1 Tax=Macrostomum lignano TaxID=282301 RepID=A0A267F6X3_9PLAT|nr:hypothetical protein BOX15_Mlig022140g2 [Macrostomum lignano]
MPTMNILLLLFVANVPQLTNQLPTAVDASQRQSQDFQSSCTNPLHFIAPGTRCAGPNDRLTAYFMSVTSEDSSNCPAQSVCLTEAETAACPLSLLSFVTGENNCPTWAPLRLFEYYNQPSLDTVVEVQFSASICPLRPRCVPLRCFDNFCQSKPQTEPDIKSGDEGKKVDNESGAAAPTSWNRPALMRNKTAYCEFLQCGCPVTEADLLAEGCATPDQLLIIRADPINGCPAKLCVNKLPESLEPLSPPRKDVSNVENKRQVPRKAQDCSSRSVTCPPGTRELTVPNPVPGKCPVRICLVPELLENGFDTTKTAATDATAEADTTLEEHDVTPESTRTETTEENVSTAASTAGETTESPVETTVIPTASTMSSDSVTTSTASPDGSTSSSTAAPPVTTAEDVFKRSTTDSDQAESKIFNTTSIN